LRIETVSVHGESEQYDSHPWLRQYPSNVPRTVEVASDSIWDALEGIAARFPGNGAFVFQKSEISFKRLLNHCNRMASALHTVGVKKGDVVGIYLPMIPELPVAMLACARIGAPHSVVFGGFDGRVIAFTGDDGGTIHAWDSLTSDQLDLPIPKAQDWVTTLTYGEIRDNPALAIGAADGTVRIWCGATQQTIAEVQLHAAPQDMVIHPDGYLCIGTKMGVVMLRIGADL